MIFELLVYWWNNKTRLQRDSDIYITIGDRSSIIMVKHVDELMWKYLFKLDEIMKIISMLAGGVLFYLYK